MNHQHWHGFTDGRFGYGSMLNGFLSQLPKGVKLSEKASTSIYMGLPFACKGFLEGQWKVNFTMWETDELHSRFVAWIPQYDQILVPCEHNLEMFSRHHRNVSYVPLGVDGKVWRPVPQPANRRFRIHGGGSMWHRKGLDLLVAACRLLKFDHELHIKLAPHARDNPPLETMPEVVFNRQWLTQDEQLAFLNQADLWVTPARGEGFGLIPLQAIACGKPTILTATSGQAQFAHHATHVVSHRKVPSGGPGRWDEADPRELADAITDCYNNLSKWQRKAAANREAAVTEFSWKKATEKLVKAVPAGGLLTGGKHVPLDTKVKFRVSRATESSVNGKLKSFLPGVDYVDSEGVFEVLWHAGYIER